MQLLETLGEICSHVTLVAVVFPDISSNPLLCLYGFLAEVGKASVFVPLNPLPSVRKYLVRAKHRVIGSVRTNSVKTKSAPARKVDVLLLSLSNYIFDHITGRNI